MSDPGITYWTKEEVGDIRKTVDPITLIKKIIIDNDILNEEELKDIDN